MEETIKAYEQSINNRINKTKSNFAYVYHIMHPFEINTDTKDGIYNEKLEEQLFEYELSNLVLEYFGSLEGFSDEVLIDEDFIFKGIIDDSFKISDTKSWFSIKKDGKRLNKEDHPEFLEKFHQIAERYFEKSENWDYYTNDDFTNNKFWNWEKLTWKSFCTKFKIPYDSSIRISRIWAWQYENGYPTNIKPPRETLDQETKKRIEAIANTISAEIDIWSYHDAYVSIVGCSKDIKEELVKLDLEFTEEH